MNNINKQNRKRFIDTGSRLAAVRGQGLVGGGLGEKREGLSIKRTSELTDTGNSMELTRGKVCGEVEDGEMGINGDRRLELGWLTRTTKYR